MEYINGLMGAYIKEIGKKIKYRDMVNILGMMSVLTKVIGQKIICTDKACILGLMVENMKEITKMTKNTVMVYTLIQMDALTKDNGQMENRMVKGYL